MHKKLLKDLIEVEKLVGSAEHLIIVTYPIVKDTKLLLRGLETLNQAVIMDMSIILKLEYFFKRVNLTGDSEKNVSVFFQRCALRYGLNEVDVGVLKELLIYSKKYKESGFEFTRGGKAVILHDKYGFLEISYDKMREFLYTSKRLLYNTNSYFRELF